ncbi:MAG: virulence protein E [Lewinellaceae bacterium]|nr:virulence protein E [Lewinellaceae bacterium]
MIQFGNKITQTGDPLQKMEVEKLFQSTSRPKQSFQDFITQLRAVKTLDENQYRELKKQLPYFVCGIFHPPVRRGENFASIEHFILDLDHLEKAGLDKTIVGNQLRKDPEVSFFFTSPGGDGLKVLFNLGAPCRDAALFTAFYKLFARHFAEKYGLLEAIDLRTSDVTRACFVSYDPEAWFNPDARSVAMEDYITGLDFDKAEKALKETEELFKGIEVEWTTTEKPDLDNEVLLQIKQKLNPKFRDPQKKEHYVPAEIEEALPLLQEKLAEYHLEIAETQPISYGRKVKIKTGVLWAEVNIFFGKRGFRVVKTTKSGSNSELAELAAQAITEILYSKS